MPKHNVTVLDGIREKAGKKVKVLYSEGCKITIGGNWNQDEVIASDPEEDRKQIAEAVEVAKQADVIVLAIGGNEQTSREAWALKHMGDRTSLDLIGRQEELVKAMVALGKPVIAFLFNGRPLSINYLSRKRAGHLRVLVSRPGNRPRRCRCAFWRLQPRRQAAHHHSALRGPFARVLQLQAFGAARLSVGRCVAALSRLVMASVTQAFPSATRD